MQHSNASIIVAAMSFYKNKKIKISLKIYGNFWSNVGFLLLFELFERRDADFVVYIDQQTQDCACVWHGRKQFKTFKNHEKSTYFFMRTRSSCKAHVKNKGNFEEDSNIQILQLFEIFEFSNLNLNQPHTLKSNVRVSCWSKCATGFAYPEREREREREREIWFFKWELRKS